MRKLQESGSTTVRETFIPDPQSKIQPSLAPKEQASFFVFSPYLEGTQGGQGEELKSNTEMQEPNIDSAVVNYAIALLSHYGFELRGYTAEELVNLWLKNYPTNWIRLAVIEALYQGRYKAVSVEQMLTVWCRRGQPFYRFNGEFERLISRKLPQNLTASLGTASTDLLQDYNLPLLAACSEDTTVEPEMPEQNRLSHETTIQEYFTQTAVPLDNEPPNTRTNPSFSPTYEADWSRSEVRKQPIHQFTPQPDSSDFYLKLKSVVQHQEENPPIVATPPIEE